MMPAQPLSADQEDSSPNRDSRERSLLAIAAFNGFADIAHILVRAGANRHPGGIDPLLAALNQNNREVLAVLLEGHPEDVMLELEGKTPGTKLEYIRQAIAHQSVLLPLIASLRQRRLRELGQPDKPPAGLSRKQKGIFKDALKMEDDSMTSEFVRLVVERIKCPWRQAARDDDLFLTL
jgi:hypothetical protein